MGVLIGEAARASGLSVDAIRYYESLGLTAPGSRNSAGRRTFSGEDVVWLVFLRRMRETGMPIAELQEYLRCRREGVEGTSGVLVVLHRHRHALASQQARLTACAEVIDAKIAKYERLARQRAVPGPPEVDLE